MTLRKKKKSPAALRSNRQIKKRARPAIGNTRRLKQAKPPRPPYLMNLLNDAMWLAALAAALYGTLALAGFTMDDPAWSRGIAVHGTVHNPAGVFGAYVADIAYYLFGLSSWWLPVAAAVVLYKGFRPLNRKTANDAAAGYHSGWSMAGLAVLLLFSPVLEIELAGQDLKTALPLGAGGLVGHFASAPVVQLLGSTGSVLVVLAALLLGMSLLFQISWLALLEHTGSRLEWLWNKLLRRTPRETTGAPKGRMIRRMIKKAEAITAEVPELPPSAVSNRKAVPIRTAPAVQRDLFDSAEKNAAGTESSADSTTGMIRLPDTALLKKAPDTPIAADTAQLQETALRIENKLKEFGVAAEVTGATAGPVITRYEIEPAQGVKGSQIVHLGKDLARALSVQSVRIVETIAGKSAMGIELPNTQRQNVFLSEILAAGVFRQSAEPLTVAMGKDIAGIPMVADLAKMPHLLVAGTTGSGKSVGVNCMILSILFKAQPDEVRFIMVDPKMLELSVYDGIPHLLAPVVTDMREAAQALNWCVAEMEKRYKLLAHAGVRNITGFNDKIAQAVQDGRPLPDPFTPNPDDPEPLQKLPYIVVVIDELADLMMVEGKKVEQQIARLAQKARAAGIHLILATQRPSVDVITGLIKANIPTRVSFQVSSKIDSRTILDQAGAENLLGKGDMLFLPPGHAVPERLHGAFVSDEEVHEIVGFIKRQAPARYVDGLLSGAAAEATDGLIRPNAGSDELYGKAELFVIETGKTSVSSLQRHLRIGYNRAANLMEALETAGVVSAAETGGSRRLLVKSPARPS